jgi:putative endonuclease
MGIPNLLLNRRKLLSDPKRLGRWGEKRSESFLKRKGLKTLTRNFACKTGEIDLVMVAPDGTITFVEVRTRSDDSFGPPELSVTHAKRNRLLRTARHFLATNNIENRPFRFDIVTIVLGRKGRPKLEHYKNAFVP